MSGEPVEWTSEQLIGDLPADTSPPSWVTDSGVRPDGFLCVERSGCWSAVIPCWSDCAPVSVRQMVWIENGRLSLSAPWVEIEPFDNELTATEAREISRALVKAAKVQEDAQEATELLWERSGHTPGQRPTRDLEAPMASRESWLTGSAKPRGDGQIDVDVDMAIAEWMPPVEARAVGQDMCALGRDLIAASERRGQRASTATKHPPAPA